MCPGPAQHAYPGSTNNTSLTAISNPNNLSNSGNPTTANVTGISAPATTMTATMVGGRFPPTLTSITPNTSPQDVPVSITNLAGGLFVKGATFLLRDGLLNEYPATNVRWIGKAKLVGDFTLAGVPVGIHDVVVRNPDGQEAVLINGFVVDGPVPVLVQAFDARMVSEGVELSWSIYADETVSGLRMSREDIATGRVEVLNSGHDLPSSVDRYIDSGIAGGATYRYILVVRTAAGVDVRSAPALVSAPACADALGQNHPNPFNPSTTIHYSIRSTAPVTLQVYSPAGQMVRTLVKDVQSPRPAGYDVVWDGRNNRGAQVGSGVYLYKLTVGNRFSSTHKLLLLK